jgi:hypothetical protein
MIWTATCPYCGRAETADEQTDAVAEFGDHFAVDHAGLPATLAWAQDGSLDAPAPVAAGPSDLERAVQAISSAPDFTTAKANLLKLVSQPRRPK